MGHTAQLRLMLALATALSLSCACDVVTIDPASGSQLQHVNNLPLVVAFPAYTAALFNGTTMPLSAMTQAQLVSFFGQTFPAVPVMLVFVSTTNNEQLPRSVARVNDTAFNLTFYTAGAPGQMQVIVHGPAFVLPNASLPDYTLAHLTFSATVSTLAGCSNSTAAVQNLVAAAVCPASAASAAAPVPTTVALASVVPAADISASNIHLQVHRALCMRVLTAAA